MSSERAQKISSLFESMEIVPAKDNAALLHKWLHQRQYVLTHFVNNQWQSAAAGSDSGSDSVGDSDSDSVTIVARDSQETLASCHSVSRDQLDCIVEAAVAATDRWTCCDDTERSTHLYNVWRCLEKHADLLAPAVCQDSGASLRYVRSCRVPRAVHCAHYYAGRCAPFGEQLASHSAVGVVVVVPAAWCPLVSLVEHVMPALAAANTVIVLPSVHAPLTALVFADICAEAGLPAGVVSVAPVSQAGWRHMSAHRHINALTVSGTLSLAQQLTVLTPPTHQLTLDVAGQCNMIIMESADLHSAIDSIVEHMASNDPDTAVSLVLVQQSVFDVFRERLLLRMRRLRVGAALDASAHVMAVHQRQLAPDFVLQLDALRQGGAQVFQCGDAAVCGGAAAGFVPPTLVSDAGAAGVAASRQLAHCPPVLVAEQFRTAREGLALANSCAASGATSVWSSRHEQALEVARQLQTGTVWLNCHGQWRAGVARGYAPLTTSAPLGGRLSQLRYVRDTVAPLPVPAPPAPAEAECVLQFGVTDTLNSHSLKILDSLPGPHCASAQDVKLHMFWGGAKMIGHSGRFFSFSNAAGTVTARVPLANSRDVNCAVQAAAAQSPIFAKFTAYRRSRLLLSLAEAVRRHARHLVDAVVDWTGVEEQRAQREVEVSAACFVRWAGLCDELYGGSLGRCYLTDPLDDTTSVLHLVEPVGVVAAVWCGPVDEGTSTTGATAPLLSTVAVVAPLVACGNCVVLVPPDHLSPLVLSLSQVLVTAGVPAGVVNILSGSSDFLCRQLATIAGSSRSAPNAVWLRSSVPSSSATLQAAAGYIRQHCESQLQCRVWIDTWLSAITSSSSSSSSSRPDPDWQHYTSAHSCCQLIRHATNVKPVWMCSGHAFAN